jgi:ABC-type lipoprotein release transport system permease subunit
MDWPLFRKIVGVEAILAAIGYCLRHNNKLLMLNILITFLLFAVIGIAVWGVIVLALQAVRYLYQRVA